MFRSLTLCLALVGLFAAVMARGQGLALIVRGPYLQSATTNSITVRWRTDIATESRVRFGTMVGNLGTEVADSALTTEHAVTLVGLAPDTSYFYAIIDGSNTLVGGPSYFFTTAPAHAKPTRIWAIGDAGTASVGVSAPLVVRDAYANYTGLRPTDVWLMLGDNAYYTGTDAEYQVAVFDVFQEMLRTTTVWPTLGNHETYSATGGRMAYDEIFNLPQDGRAGGVPSGSERYYSFNHGNIHFVSLDSELASKQTGGPMLSWLEQDLAATESDWIIAYWHSPPYSKGSHDSDLEGNLIGMREQVVPLLESYGVDLVLCGHSHSYERSYLLNGHYGSSATLTSGMLLDAGSGRPEESGAYLKSLEGPDAQRGAVYVVAGSSGQTGYGSFDHPAIFFSLNRLGSMVIDIEGNRLDARFLRENGQVDDHFNILKGDQAPSIVTAPQNRTTVEGATVSFNVVATGTRPLSYQWLFNGAPLAGATNATLTLSGVQASQAGPYSVLVSNRVGQVTSTEAQLIVNPAPTCVTSIDGLVSWWPFDEDERDIISGHDAALVGTPGFGTGMSEGGLFFDGVNDQAEVASSADLDIGAGTGFTIELWIKPVFINSPQPLLEWNNSQGSVGLQFWIAQPPPAGNGDGSLFASLADTSGSANWVASPAGVLSRSNDWNHAALTYDRATGVARLFANGAQVAQVNIGAVTVQTSYDLFIGRRVAVSGSNFYYSGGMDEVSIFNRALDDDEIQAIADAGPAAKCKAPTAPRISSQPTSRTVGQGSTVGFNVVADGTRPLTYQWFFNGELLEGATNASLILGNVQVSQSGEYSVAVSNVVGITTSEDAILAVTPAPACAPPATSLVSWWPLDGDGQDIAGSNTVAVVGNPSFGGGKVGTAMFLDGLNDQGEVSSSGSLNIGLGSGMTIELWINPASLNVPQPLVEWNNRQGAVGVQFWISQPPPAGSGAGSLFASMVDLNGGSTWVASPAGVLTAGAWQHVALSYDKVSGICRFFVNGDMVKEQNIGQKTLHTTYDLFLGRRVAVSGTNFRYTGGMDEVSIYGRALSVEEIQSIAIAGLNGKCRIPRAPEILSNPADLTVTEGNTASFAVAAAGTAPLEYQWLYNGAPLAGATNSTLALNQVQMSQAGRYSAIVSNLLGTATSAEAVLTVVFPPATLRIADAQGSGGTTVEVPVLLRANGNENALGFSINFNPVLLSFDRVELGSDAPASSAIVANPADAASGRIGVAMALPADTTFSSGTQDVIRVFFVLAPAFSALSTPLSFGDVPTVRQVSDPEAHVLAANYVGGSVVVLPTDLEGDVAPRPDGDRTVTVIDWVQMGRFVAGLNAVSSSNEFQKADCAPRSLRGNGVLGITDWVQAGRYAAGLDPVTPVGGPTEEAAPALGFQAPPATAASPNRIVRLVNASALPGTTSNIPVKLTAQGNENALGFSVAFDASKLRFVGALPGGAAANALLNLNRSQLDQGRLGLALGLPAGSMFAAGERELVLLQFAPIDPASGSTPIGFADAPVRREVSDVLAEPLAATFSDAVVTLQPAGPPLSLSLSAGNLVIYWPQQESAGFELESASQLNEATWSKVNIQPIIIGGQKIVTVPASGAHAWYRLRKP